MEPYKIWLLPLIVTAVIGVTLAYSALAAPDSDTSGSATEIAMRFLLEKSPTYLYDGISGRVSAGSLVSLGDRGWEVTLLFTSRTAGYGDRSGQMTAQVLANHSIRIVVALDGAITSAVIDGAWNELSQKPL
ncbi:MAG: hypothetical protein HYY22_10850 [Thaumarchaeota archaeon]|nr:hypothetical protein [Nitrososphaerota archaeon]